MCEMVKRLNHHFVMVEFPPKRTRWSKVSQSLCVLQQDDQLLVRALLLVSNVGFGERISPGWFSVIETKGSHTEASPVEMLLCHMKKVGFFSARLEHWGCPWPLHIWCAWSQKTHRNTLMKVFHCHSCWGVHFRLLLVWVANLWCALNRFYIARFLQSFYLVSSESTGKPTNLWCSTSRSFVDLEILLLLMLLLNLTKPWSFEIFSECFYHEGNQGYLLWHRPILATFSQTEGSEGSFSGRTLLLAESSIGRVWGGQRLPTGGLTKIPLGDDLK